MTGSKEFTWLWYEGRTEGGKSAWKKYYDRVAKSLRPWAKMVQGQWEGMEVKDKRKERQELGWDEHKHGLNSIDWEVKKDVSREGGSKLMNKM